MTRLVLMLLSVVAGAALAVAATFIVVSAVNGSFESPVNQTLYNYGSR